MEISQVMHRDCHLTSFICLTCMNNLNVAFDFKQKCDKLNAARGRRNIKRTSTDVKSRADADSDAQLDEGNQFKCALCMRIFHTKSAIQQHLSRHQTKRQQYNCQNCRLRFLTTTHLTEHRCESQK